MQVNESAAVTVRHIFNRYLEIGSAHALQRELRCQGIVSKLRTYSTGRTSGGGEFSRGALFHMLRNRIYLGQIVHKDQVFEGEHDGIVDAGLFERVQSKLDGNAQRHRAAADTRVTRAPLTGKLFDASGEVMSPSFSRGRSGRVYRYYVSASLQQGARRPDGDIEGDVVRRLPADAAEAQITDLVKRWLPREEHPLGQVLAVRIADGGLLLDCPGKRAADISGRLSEGERIVHSTRTICRIHVAVSLPLRGGKRLIVKKGKPDIRPDATLISALRRAHAMLDRDRKGMPLIEISPASPYLRKLLRLAFLAPDIQADILAGRQPGTLNLQQLLNTPMPLCWSEQRKLLKWPGAQ